MEKFEILLGARLKEGRDAAGLTLDEAANRIDYSKGSLSNVENGKDRPGRRLFVKLLALYGLNRKWVETGVGPMHTESHIQLSNEVGKNLGITGLVDARTSRVDFSASHLVTLASLAKNLRVLQRNVSVSAEQLNSDIDQLAGTAEKLSEMMAKQKSAEKNNPPKP